MSGALQGLRGSEGKGRDVPCRVFLWSMLKWCFVLLVVRRGGPARMVRSSHAFPEPIDGRGAVDKGGGVGEGGGVGTWARGPGAPRGQMVWSRTFPGPGWRLGTAMMAGLRDRFELKMFRPESGRVGPKGGSGGRARHFAGERPPRGWARVSRGKSALSPGTGRSRWTS